MKYLVVFLLLLSIINCYASIEQVGDTQINLLNVDNKLIKQNLIEIQCEYGPTHTVHQKDFSTTDGDTTINVQCPEAIKVYDSNIKGYVPEETFVKSIEICESGVTPFWNYDMRPETSQNRRLSERQLNLEECSSPGSEFCEKLAEVEAARAETLSALDKMVNTAQVGCRSPEQFYGGEASATDACNANGQRYSQWKSYMEGLWVGYDDNGDGLKDSCWGLYTQVVLKGEEIIWANFPQGENEIKQAIGNTFRCFIAIMGFSNIKSQSGKTDLNLWCGDVPDGNGFDQDRKLLKLNTNGGPTCDVTAWLGVTATGTAAPVGSALAVKKVVALKAAGKVAAAALAGPVSTGLGLGIMALASPFLIAYCANGASFQGAAIRVGDPSLFGASATYVFDQRCGSENAMAFYSDCFPDNDDLFYNIVYCAKGNCKWRDNTVLQPFLNQYYACVSAKDTANNDKALKTAVEGNSKAISENIKAIAKTNEFLMQTNADLRDLADDVTSLTGVVDQLATDTQAQFGVVATNMNAVETNLLNEIATNTIAITQLITDSSAALAAEMEQISNDLVDLIDKNTVLIKDLTQVVITDIDETKTAFANVNTNFLTLTQDIQEVTGILLENFYKEANRNKQILDLYNNVIENERKMNLRLAATEFIHEMVKQWNTDPNLELFTLSVGELPYFDPAVDDIYVPIMTQVWKRGLGDLKYFGFFCQGDRVASFASIEIDVSLLLSLFEGDLGSPLCVISEFNTGWVGSTIQVTVQDLYDKLTLDDSLTWTDFVIKREQSLYTESTYQVKTFSAGDYGLLNLNDPINFDLEALISVASSESTQRVIPQNIYNGNVLTSLPYDKDIEIVWKQTASTLGLLSTRRHYGFIGEDVTFNLVDGQSNVFGDIVTCAQVSIVAVKPTKKTVYEMSIPRFEFQGETKAVLTLADGQRNIFYENMEVITNVDLPDTLRTVGDFTTSASNPFNVYDIPFEMIKIAETAEARLGSVNYIMTNFETGVDFAKDIWDLEYGALNFKPESHIGIQSFKTLYDPATESCETFNNGICSSLELFTPQSSNWAVWTPKEYKVKFQIRLNETTELLLKIEDGCPNAVPTDKSVIVENNNPFDIVYQVTVDGVVGGDQPIISQARDTFSICGRGETDIKTVSVTNSQANCPVQAMTFNCSNAVFTEDRQQLIVDVEAAIRDTVVSDFTSQIVTVESSINGTIETVETTLAEATNLVQSNLDSSVTTINGDIINLGEEFNTNLTEATTDLQNQILGINGAIGFEVDSKIQDVAQQLETQGTLTIQYDTAVVDQQISDLQTSISQQQQNIDTTISDITASINATVAQIEADFVAYSDEVTARSNQLIAESDARLNQTLDNITNTFAPLKSELEEIANSTQAIADRADARIEEIRNFTNDFLDTQIEIAENTTKELNSLEATFGNFQKDLDAIKASTVPVVVYVWMGINTLFILFLLFAPMSWLIAMKTCCGSCAIEKNGMRSYNRVAYF